MTPIGVVRRQRVKELLLICACRFSPMHWTLKSDWTSNCICLSESKHSKIHPITGQSACYLALLKDFHVLIPHNYSIPTIVLKLFLQSNTEHNIQLYSQIANLNHAFYSVGSRTRALPKSLMEICKNSTPQNRQQQLLFTSFPIH